MNNQYRNSIFNNIVNMNGFSYIHFPLIYKTTNLLIIQMYVDAIKTLFKITKLDKKYYFKIIDNLIVEYSTKDNPKIHYELINIFTNEAFIKEIVKNLDKNSKIIPNLFDIWETNIKNKIKTPKKIFKKIYQIITYSIAINYFNFFMETYLYEILSDEKNKKYNSFLEKNSFSHIKYFLDEQKNKKENLLMFAKNIGFLANEIGEKTQYENIEYLKKEINKNISTVDIFSSTFKYPEISFNKKELLIKDIPIEIKLAKIMQNNLEFRHYWQLRLTRNLRVETEENKTKIQTWLYKNYEKEIFNI